MRYILKAEGLLHQTDQTPLLLTGVVDGNKKFESLERLGIGEEVLRRPSP